MTVEYELAGNNVNYFFGTRAVGTGASPVQVSMCIRKGFKRDDYHVGNHSRATPCFNFGLLLFASRSLVVKRLLDNFLEGRKNHG